MIAASTPRPTKGINTATFGAWTVPDGTCFRIWAPVAETVDVVVETTDGRTIAKNLERSNQGMFTALVPSVGHGDTYRYRINGKDRFPDPASRFQPHGVHGASEIVDPTRFEWNDTKWRGIGTDELIIYELHIGTFTPEGTFDAACERLHYLADLGVTAIELMPVADFPGVRNWGYDGVSLFAPARCYGRPDNLRRFVDEAHRLESAVLLDVVYNRFGPDGNYLGVYSHSFFTDRYRTPWGDAHNFDGEFSANVREFFIQNAVHWVREYHLDGFRLDATHAIVDRGSPHFLAEMTDRVRDAVPERRLVIIAEDHRNLAHMVKPVRSDGWGLDAVWADEFHHQVRRFLVGDCESYFRDYEGTTEDLAATIDKGWLYCGQYSKHLGEPRGTEPLDLCYHQFIYCLQNHDQVGNRAFGERLNHQVELAAYRAAAALLLCAPATPLLFMGQEWAARSPFLYFTDHNPELGRLVTIGRRYEFRQFEAFSDPEGQATIPDPQSAATFSRSKLTWDDCDDEDHASVQRLYRALIQLRRREPALRCSSRFGFGVHALDESTILYERFAAAVPHLIVVRLKGAGTIDLGDVPYSVGDFRRAWEVVLTTEDSPFATKSNRPEIVLSAIVPMIIFRGPAAVILRGAPVRGFECA